VVCFFPVLTLHKNVSEIVVSSIYSLNNYDSLVTKTDNSRRERILMIAFSCDPDQSMEDRNGWNRAIQAAERYDVVVLTNSESHSSRLYLSVPNHLKGRIEFLSVPLSTKQQRQLNCPLRFYRGYRAWLESGKRLADKHHAERPFALTHLVSLCGYREPGNFWQLDAPFIFGPVGGTSGFPVRFLSIIDFRSGLFELARNVLNSYQLLWSRRVRLAIRGAARVIAANESSCKDLRTILGDRNISVELETALDYAPEPPKGVREVGAPLKILWTGRFRAWKGLPLLLHAIAELPSDVRVQLKIVGEGSCLQSWQKLASKLGIEAQLEWIDRPRYRESIPYYRWADVFSFTSLRDTSGTGLLEALAAGTPIIGMNHQGAADIMSRGGSIPISAESPRKAISEIRAAIIKVAGDADYLKTLSNEATQRAYDYCWDTRASSMHEIYSNTIRSNPGFESPAIDGRSTTFEQIQLDGQLVAPSPSAVTYKSNFRIL
jgi:glycosyltransferase involved in cell wall biosynthesis